MTYAHLIVDQATIDPLTPSAADHTSYQQYTSGTTGLPKSVELTNNNFFAMMPVAGQMWGFDSDSVNLLAMPLFHIAVSGWGVVGLFNDGTNILIREVDPAAILNLIPKHGVINVLFVPTVIQFLQIMPTLATTGLSTLRAVMHGASPITEDVLV
ncbi:MAG: AMP-binding protein, partial [Acidimicrobiales bacterium]